MCCSGSRTARTAAPARSPSPSCSCSGSATATRTAWHVGQRISGDEYRRLIDAGAFDEDARVELIDGVICATSPKSREHENAIAWLLMLLARTVDPDRYEVRVAAALSIGDSEPEPDVAVTPAGTPAPYHPASAALVIEVAVSSQRRDLAVKPRVYASAGVPLYWVVDLDHRRVTVHADPSPEGYRAVEVVEAGGRLDLHPLGLEPIRVADLLAAAER